MKQEIIDFCKRHGADLVGFAPAGRWDEVGEVPDDFRPRAIWAPTNTVIVVGMGMPLPMVETTPSSMHMDLYNTCNRELDGLALHLVNYLNRRGQASLFFPRDCFGSIKVLIERPLAAFAHVYAARYAGLGTIGLSHNLLTPEFGPRVRFVSVFTELELEGGPMLEQDICIRCLACVKCCPAGSLSYEKGSGKPRAEYNKITCSQWAEELTRRRCYPCGVCTKVCPPGEDRKLYGATKSMKKYLDEAAALAENIDDPRYRSWVHQRRYGSWSLGREQEKKENP